MYNFAFIHGNNLIILIINDIKPMWILVYMGFFLSIPLRDSHVITVFMNRNKKVYVRRQKKETFVQLCVLNRFPKVKKYL